jgi:glutathione S-transferase
VDLLLWHFPISHFNEKARWALDWKRLPHRRRVMSWDYLPRTWWATGQPRLPVLFVDGRPIPDSTAIIAALEQLEPEPALYPRDLAERERALAIEDFCDEQLGPAMRTAIIGPLLYHDPQAALGLLTTGMDDGARRVLGAMIRGFRTFYVRRHGIRRDNLDAARAQVRTALNRIASEIGPSGYLVGDRFTVADLTAAAMLSPIVQPAELEYRSTGPLPPLMEEYRATISFHPALRWAAEIYRRHRVTPAVAPQAAGPLAAGAV